MKKFVKILILVSVIAILTATCVFADECNDFIYSVYDDEAVITGYIGSDTNITIPDTLDGYPVTMIGAEAFKGKNLQYLDISDNVVLIGEGAFADNPNMLGVILSLKLKAIPARMCENDYSLQFVVIFGNVKSIGDEAFKNCYSLAEISYYETAERWNSLFFGANWDENMPFGYGVSSGSFFEMFSGEDYIRITGYNEPGPADVVIPSEYDGLPVTEIAQKAFQYKDITSIVIPDSVTVIESHAFANNPELTSIELPPNLEIIKSYMFSQDVGLKEVYIPASVTQIDEFAFKNCSSLENIYYGGTAQDWLIVYKDNSWDDGMNKNCIIHFEEEHLPVNSVSKPEADSAAATNLRRHAALRFTATSGDYNSFDKLGFLVSRKDAMQRYGFNLLTHDTAVYGTPLYIEAICVDETHNRIYAEDNSGVRTYSVIASIPEDKTDTVFVARPFLEIGISTVYGAMMEGSFDDLSV